MLKVKDFHDAEYNVESIETGYMQFINPLTGLNDEEEMMLKVVIKHKNNLVSVGSGFTIEERQHFYRKPSDIVGSKITVQYFEESTDKNGKISLRFPTVKVVHGKKRST